MAPVSGIPQTPPPPRGTSLDATDKTKDLGRVAGPFSGVIGGLVNAHNNLSWWLEEIKDYIQSITGFAKDLNAVEEDLKALTQNDPPLDKKQMEATLRKLTKDLKTLQELPGNVRAKLTKMAEARFGKPLPKQVVKFINAQVKRVEGWVKNLAKKFEKTGEASGPPSTQGIKQIAYLMSQILAGKVKVPLNKEAFKVALKNFKDVQGQLPDSKHPQLSPTYHLFQDLQNDVSNGIKNAESVSETMMAKEQQLASEIQMAMTGASKAADKEFKTVMAMIRSIISG